MINAGQSIGGNAAGGEIRLKTGHDEARVWAEVSDNGCGIPPDVLPHIFEPFFTTKPTGMGTGLGLSVSYGIAQRHGGQIEVESEVNKGTTFRVTLPRKPPSDA